jgi:hypothetical protein
MDFIELTPEDEAEEFSDDFCGGESDMKRMLLLADGRLSGTTGKH